MKIRKNSKKIAINIILSIFSIIWLIPIIFALLGSMKTKQEYNLGNFWDMPKSFMLPENIRLLADYDIFQGMWNSFIYASFGALFAVTLALLAAYGISHRPIKNKMMWFILIYSGTIFPFQIYLIPVYKEYVRFGLYDTKIGMIIFYTAICIPFSMFVLRNFFISISKEITESAQLDGCTSLQILTKIFIPMAKAPLSIVFLSQFTWIWNDLMFAITFTKSAEIRPIMATISQMGSDNTPALLTACMVVSIPTFLLFIFLQKNVEVGFAYQSK